MGWIVAIFGGFLVVGGLSPPSTGEQQWPYIAAVAVGAVFVLAGLIVEYLQDRK